MIASSPLIGVSRRQVYRHLFLAMRTMKPFIWKYYGNAPNRQT